MTLLLRHCEEADRSTLKSHLLIPSISAAFPDFASHPVDIWVESILTDPHSYAITLDNKVIGACRLERNTHSDFSYWLHPDHRGCGHATAINNKLCRMAISLGWTTIGGTCDENNYPSQSVLRRCGFKQISPTYWLKSL